MVELDNEQREQLDNLIKKSKGADALIFSIGTQEKDEFQIQSALIGSLPDLHNLLMANLDNLKKSAMEVMSGENMDELAKEFTEFMKAKGKDITLPPQKTKARRDDRDVEVSYR